jgi:hypothetical protein
MNERRIRTAEAVAAVLPRSVSVVRYEVMQCGAGRWEAVRCLIHYPIAEETWPVVIGRFSTKAQAEVACRIDGGRMAARAEKHGWTMVVVVQIDGV